ncbi:MAG TPA: glycosyltransferase family 1 protein [Verrucomicrobiae bacterium]|nr:glycosyltransferase family 1 protein [Verrucomicrobiae bacterium]
MRSDVLAADLAQPFQPVIPKVIPGEPLVINWVTIPAGPRAGGHTTLFRTIRHLEANGYRNRVYFYNVYRGDHRYYEDILRTSYGFHGCVASVNDGMEDAHAVVATSWPTAYPVFNSRCAGKRFYFIQDFEPYFYPVGALSLLAENTYRMPFHAITIGRCFVEKLRNDFGMSVDSFEYGCDTSRYHLLNDVKRSGVVFYARPEAARRGCEIGLMALEAFAARRPDIEIHLYGTRMGNLPFRFTDHGRVPPEELNRIYNHCYAGLSLSLTNVSLVAHEMLAAGCIPVVNDTIWNRTDVTSSFVRYAPPDPHRLAAELEAVIATADFDSLSRAAAASMHSQTWDDAGQKVDAIFRRILQASPRLSSPSLECRPLLQPTN